LLAVASSAKIAAVAMTAAWFLAIVAGNHLQTREITRLPVTRRDLWVCHWWLAVVGPGVVTGAAAAIGAAWVNSASPQLFTARDVLLPAFCAAVWGSMFLVQRPQWLTLAMGWIDRLPPRSTSRRLVGYAVVVWVLAYFIGGFALPFWIAPLVMRAAAAPTTFSYALAIGVAVLAVANYFHTPPITERTPVVRGVPPAAQSSTPKSEHVSDGPTGLRGLYWREVRWRLLVLCCILVVIVTACMMLGTPSAIVLLRAHWLLPFDGAGSDVPVVGLIVLGAMLPHPPDGVRNELRLLRTLPLTSRSLRNALTLRALLGPLMLWTAALGLHAAMLRTVPESFRLDLLLALLGVVAMVQASALAITGTRASRWAAAAGMALVGAGANVYVRFEQTPWALIGGSLLMVAMWLSEWSIRRRGLLYARHSAPTA
jgi:hypothetical protein